MIQVNLRTWLVTGAAVILGLGSGSGAVRAQTDYDRDMLRELETRIQDPNQSPTAKASDAKESAQKFKEMEEAFQKAKFESESAKEAHRKELEALRLELTSRVEQLVTEIKQVSTTNSSLEANVRAGAMTDATTALSLLGTSGSSSVVYSLIQIVENQPVIVADACGDPHRGRGGPPGSTFADYLYGRNARIAAINALGELRSPLAVPSLAGVLLYDRYAGASGGDQWLLHQLNVDVRVAAAKALGLIGSRSGLGALSAAASSDSNGRVREAAKSAINLIQTANK